ncbi:MAG: DUF3305 domain-containing protein [Rhodospirillaceae bacterium]
MNASAATSEKLSVGVVIERRDSDNRWLDYTWHPIAVIPGAPPLEDANQWQLMREGEGWSQFLAGTLEIELHRGETEGYRANLSSTPAQVYVVLVKGEEADEPDMVPFLVTACPYEAESYTESGEHVVEGVVMPAEIEAWVRTFVDTHHVEQPFRKRKQRKAYDPRKGDFSRRDRGGKPGGGEHE